MTQRHTLFFIIFLLGLLLFIGGFLLYQPSSAQEQPVPTAVPNAERALSIYSARCANCHGPQGAGNGELAAQSINPPTNFTEASYRQTAVPAELFSTIQNGRLSQGMPLFGEGSSNPLTEEQMWDLVALIYSFSTPSDSIARGSELANGETPPANLPFWHTTSNQTALQTLIERDVLSEDLPLEDQQALIDYLRTGSYQFVDVALLTAPIETAVITGTLFNGTTETAVSDLEVTLQAFTLDLAEVANTTTTADADGTYRFDLEEVGPDWVYLLSANYQGYDFSSAPAQLSRSNPAAELPITVYDTTTAEQSVAVEHVQLIIDFVETGLQVAEVYTLSNLSDSLFVGPEADPDSGTVAFALPAGAMNVQFQRSFGVESNFTAAPNIIQQGNGYVDTFPLPPGRGVMEILVTYTLPYDTGLTLAHPLPYFTNQASLILPDNGVLVSGDGWQFQGQEVVPIGPVNTFINNSMQTADVLTLRLDGRPGTIRNAEGNAIIQRNLQRELIIGSLALLATAIFLFTAYSYQSANQASTSADALLQQLAHLDDAYAKGTIIRTHYLQKRAAIKAALIDLWRDKSE